MGAGALRLTSLYQHQADDRLVMQQLPVAGLNTTFSANSDVTDSAAAATALATGYKTDNGMLGLTPDKRRLTPFTEVARAQGRAIGLVTSDAITGGTPAGFYAHADTRGTYSVIAEDALRSGFDLLIGNTSGRAWFLPKTQGGQRADTRDLLAEWTRKGALADSLETLEPTPRGKPLLAFLDAKTVLHTEPILGQLTDFAMNRLAANEKGFFLLVECTITDGGGHSNKPETTVLGTLQIDWAVRRAVDFARARGDTLVLVTADHETGALRAVRSPATPDQLLIHYGTTSHTADPVPLYAYGPGAERFAGVTDNTDVARFIARLWNLTLPPPANVTRP